MAKRERRENPDSIENPKLRIKSTKGFVFFGFDRDEFSNVTHFNSFDNSWRVDPKEEAHFWSGPRKKQIIKSNHIPQTEYEFIKHRDVDSDLPDHIPSYGSVSSLHIAFSIDGETFTEDLEEIK